MGVEACVLMGFLLLGRVSRSWSLAAREMGFLTLGLGRELWESSYRNLTMGNITDGNSWFNLVCACLNHPSLCRDDM